MARPRRSGEGSPRQRDRKVQPPRPPNAWILYRSFKFALIRETNERLSQAAVSKRISSMWKNETPHVRRHFERQAEVKKAEHQAQYPDYRFCPKRKETKSRKKSKAREAIPSDVDEDDEDDDAPSTVPALPPMHYMHQSLPQPFPVPGYQPMPQPYMIPYLPKAHYGPGGPSPPISAVPSPAPFEGSQSPHLEENAVSSSSSPSTRPSPSSGSRASSSSSQLPANPMYLPSLPASHQPSPNPYATQPLSTLLFQTPAHGELPLTSPRAQLRSPENTLTPAAPVWNNIPTQLPSSGSQNSEEVINFDIAISQPQTFTEFQQSFSASSSFDSLQGLLSRTDETGVFNLSNIDSSDLLAQPQGDLEVVMGPQASIIDYHEELFADFDFVEFQRQMDSLSESGSSSAPLTSFPSVQDDLRSLFHTPNNPDVQAYRTAQQRQPSVFTQDMMHFLNFDGVEDSTEGTSTAVSSAPVPTTVAPQQVRLQSPQVAAAMPIFTQTTNTSTVASGTSYVPPAGAIYSSTRRVAGSWKPSFVIPPSQMEEPVQSWTL